MVRIARPGLLPMVPDTPSSVSCGLGSMSSRFGVMAYLGSESGIYLVGFRQPYAIGDADPRHASATIKGNVHTS